MDNPRPPFRYPYQEEILRRMAIEHGLTFDEVLHSRPGTRAFAVRREAIKAAEHAEAYAAGCVETDRIGRPVLRVVGGRDIPLSEFGPEPGPEIIDESHHIKRRGIDWLMVFAVIYSAFYWTVFLILPLALLVMSLTGCSTVPERTKPPECITCVGPYDIGLTSHREALK